MNIPSPSEHPDQYDDYDGRLAGRGTSISTSPELQQLIDARNAPAATRLMTVEGHVVAMLAEAAMDKLSRQCIKRLQRAVPGLLADQGAKNLWDEICVQTQTDSDWLELYKEDVEQLLTTLASELAPAERLALWLQTYNGECFREDMEIHAFDPRLIPISDWDIAKHMLSQVVCYEAANYENARIRAMLGR